MVGLETSLIAQLDLATGPTSTKNSYNDSVDCSTGTPGPIVEDTETFFR